MTSRIYRVNLYTEGAGQVARNNRRVCAPWGICVRQFDIKCRDQRGRAASQSNCQAVSFATVPLVHRTAAAQTHGCYSKPKSWRRWHTGVSRQPPLWSISPYCVRLTTDCSTSALGGISNHAASTMCVPTHAPWPSLAATTSRRQCQSGQYFWRGSWLE